MVKQVVLAVVVGLTLFAGTAQAQETLLINIGARWVENHEEFRTVSPVRAEDIVFGDEEVALEIYPTAQDWLDPNKAFWYRIFRSNDNGATWKSVAAGRFTGAADNGPAGFTGVSGAAAVYVGTLIKIEVDVMVTDAQGVPVPSAQNRMRVSGKVVIRRPQ